ncbi:Lariat debranching enzyme [Yarrowia sp. C11]|nr:Lariat debranching enzyme [Yarrowia sp. E02]KAG5369215.1 Lariat debranching enzyme [Yarrowia sp. C11]
MIRKASRARKKIMNVFFEGCCHGDLDKIYQRVNAYNLPVDLLLIGGDFQAIRNEQDLLSMNVPAKYREMHDFHKYYSGEAQAPYLTVIIGGNHESSGYMQELYYGGWLAPNIYYLGAAGVINYKGLRIGGISGIFNERSYKTGHHEKLPYDNSTIRSVYHVKAHDVMKASLIDNGIDIFMSHDWPAGIEHFGNTKKLLQEKKHFKADINNGTLGSPPAMDLLKQLRPAHWLSAHLHCKFQATVDHEKLQEEANGDTKQQSSPAIKNPDEIVLDEFETETKPETKPETTSETTEIDISDDILGEESAVNISSGEIDLSEDMADSPTKTTSSTTLTIEKKPLSKKTNFLALDKCLPKRKFIEKLNIDHECTSDGLQYDPEWLSIVRCTNHLFSRSHALHQAHPTTPEEIEALKKMVKEDYAWVKENIVDKGKLGIPENFVKTAPVYTGADIRNVGAKKQLPKYNNPQTAQFLKLLDIPNKL